MAAKVEKTDEERAFDKGRIKHENKVSDARGELRIHEHRLSEINKAEEVYRKAKSWRWKVFTSLVTDDEVHPRFRRSEYEAKRYQDYGQVQPDDCSAEQEGEGALSRGSARLRRLP